MKAVVVAHGDVHPDDRSQLAGADLIVAADGGARALDEWGVLPNLVVGDLDSLDRDRATQYGWKGVKISKFPREKDESDLELALQAALEGGAEEIVLLGLFGGKRLDYTLANALLLADTSYAGVSLRAVHGDTTLRALHGGGRLEILCDVGDLVTLLPVHGDAEGVSTEGLRYALRSGTLRFGRARGASNVVTSSPASVALERGTLLVIESRADR